MNLKEYYKQLLSRALVEEITSYEYQVRNPPRYGSPPPNSGTRNVAASVEASTPQQFPNAGTAGTRRTDKPADKDAKTDRPLSINQDHSFNISQETLDQAQTNRDAISNARAETGSGLSRMARGADGRPVSSYVNRNSPEGRVEASIAAGKEPDMQRDRPRNEGGRIVTNARGVQNPDAVGYAAGQRASDASLAADARAAKALKDLTIMNTRNEIRTKRGGSPQPSGKSSAPQLTGDALVASATDSLDRAASRYSAATSAPKPATPAATTPAAAPAATTPAAAPKATPAATTPAAAPAATTPAAAPTATPATNTAMQSSGNIINAIASLALGTIPSSKGVPARNGTTPPVSDPERRTTGTSDQMRVATDWANKGLSPGEIAQRMKTVSSMRNDDFGRRTPTVSPAAQAAQQQRKTAFDDWDSGKSGNPKGTPLTNQELGIPDNNDAVSAKVGFDVASSRDRTSEVLRQSKRAEILANKSRDTAARLRLFR